jgi:hypothetical protein
MAAVLASSSAHSSSHLFVPHRDNFAAFHPHRSSFGAFAPHHQSSGSSRSGFASWRHSELQAVVPAPARVDTHSPKYRRSGPSHSRTPSTSSEASSTSWRSHVRSQSVTRVDVAGEPGGGHLTFYCPLTLSNNFFRSPRIERFFAVRLFRCRAASAFSLTSRRHQQGVPRYSGGPSCSLCVAPRSAVGHSEGGSPW